MVQILPIMLFGNSIKYALYFSHAPLCSVYSYFYTYVYSMVLDLLQPFYLHTKSDTFGTLSLSRIVDAEVSFSSPSLTFDL